MTSAQQWSAIVGALLPLIMAGIIQEHWSNTVKSWVAFAACVAAGLAVTYFAGTLVFTAHDAMTIGTDIALVATAAWATYREFWKPTGIAPTVQSATDLPHITVTRDTPQQPTPPAEPQA